MREPPPRKVSRFAAMSSQTSHARWRLHIATVDDKARRNTVVTLKAGATVIGRDPEGTGDLIAIDDEMMSRTHATLVVRGPGKRVEVIDHSSRNGTWHDGRPVEGTAWVADDAVLRFGGMVAVLESDHGLVPDGIGPSADVPGMSAHARRIRDVLETAAGDDMPILVVGDPATGKLGAARFVHEMAGRGGPLVRVDVAQLRVSEFETTLFGRGPRRGEKAGLSGKFHQAHNGSLVLENITELSAQQQVKLLRTLEERMVYPIGSGGAMPIDVRVIACGADDLRQRVRDGRFHRGLANQLHSHEVHMPSLRRRLPDLISLADALVRPPEPDHSWSDCLDADAVEVLLLQRWKHNCSGLEAVMKGAVLLLNKGHSGVGVLPEVLVEHVQDRVAHAERDETSPVGEAPVSKVGRAESRPDAHVLRELMARHDGNLGAVARELGAHRRQVYRWLDYAGVPRDFVG
jgi:sigma-54 dependent transcriptional regulator, acetoin dehydrogenase operon transcriptional activator AcoR